MSTDEPFCGACYPEPLNDNGEKLIAAVRVDEMMANEHALTHAGIRAGQRQGTHHVLTLCSLTHPEWRS